MTEDALHKPDKVAKLTKERDELLQVLSEVDRFFASTLDPTEDQETWEWLCWLKVQKALGNFTSGDDHE